MESMGVHRITMSSRWHWRLLDQSCVGSIDVDQRHQIFSRVGVHVSTVHRSMMIICGPCQSMQSMPLLCDDYLKSMSVHSAVVMML